MIKLVSEAKAQAICPRLMDDGSTRSGQQLYMQFEPSKAMLDMIFETKY